MADFDNLAEINENFDTIKTLLNSIRAQGILNTSDVDKLLSGINMKLEKLNTEEDIDLIKIFLSELKQNFEERHGILVSKFAAIESLFANLLKNSSEMLKSSEVKELFDIVATNLSVFSREVVSQKESLTDISLRLDAIRSDDSQKKDIIKNIVLLKSDIERISNGFDSIVISLNDNFKTVVKSITTLDKTEYLEKFSDVLLNIEMSSNTVLSAIQLLDKKAEQVEQALKDVATKDDMAGAAQKIFELTAQSHELSAVVGELNNKYIKFDTLADKIDASVNIIATLKSTLEDTDNKNAQKLLEEMSILQNKFLEVSSEEKYSELKQELSDLFKFIQERFDSIGNRSVLVFEEVQKLASMLQALDLNEGLEALEKLVKDSTEYLANNIEQKIQNVTLLSEANVTKTINEISAEAMSLSSKLVQAQTEIGILCEKNFSSVFEKISDIKTLIAQVDENSVSANNAIFSSITDRLSIFETGLRESLELQEKTVLHSSAQLVEQIENIKNISNVLDYKLDTSVVEAANVKKEFAELKKSVENVLALDFTTAVKDLRVDLYAVKQEMSNVFENSSSELTERFTSDLYGKYELLISKLDTVEDDLRKYQTASLGEIKTVLDGIASSIVDVLSYVSEKKSTSVDYENAKLDEIINLITDTNINYVENVRDIVDIIRVQVEANIKSIEEELLGNFDNVNRVISRNSEDIKNEIRHSYTKLLEVQEANNELQELLNVTKELETTKFAEVLTSTSDIKVEFDSKIENLKKALLENISEFKTEFSCENADKISEIKFSVETLYGKNAQDLKDLVAEMRTTLSKISTDEINGRVASLAKISDNFGAIKDLLYNLQDKNAEILNEKVETVLEDFVTVKKAIENLDEAVDGDMSRQISIIENKFETLISQLTLMFDKSEMAMTNRVDVEFANISDNFSAIKDLLYNLQDKNAEILNERIETVLEDFAAVKKAIENLDEAVDGDMSRQVSIIESNFEALISQLTILFDKSEMSMTNRVDVEFAKISELMQASVEQKLEDYKNSIESVFADLQVKNSEQAEYVQERITSLNSSLRDIWAEQSRDNAEQITSLTKDLQTILSDSTENSKEKLNEFKSNLEVFANEVFESNKNISAILNQRLEEIAKYTNTILDTLAQENEERQSELVGQFAEIKEEAKALSEVLKSSIEEINLNVTTSTKENLLAIEAYINNLLQQFELQKNNVVSCKDLIIKSFNTEIKALSASVEKETDVIIGELIEQFDLLKKSQADDIVNIVSNIEEVVNAQIYNNIEDLKSYLDIKTDNSVLNAKFDNLKVELVSNIDSVIEGMSKLLDSGAFVSSIADFKLANEVLVNNAVDNLNAKLENFISDILSNQLSTLEINDKKIQDCLSVLDKKFVDTLIDKFEEIKLTTNTYGSSYNKLQETMQKIFTEFDFVKQNVINEIESLADIVKNSVASTNTAIGKLNEGFEALKEQILNREFDECFQTALNKQIAEIENLISEQMAHIEDIEDVCMANLPDVAEMNTLVKHSIINSLDDINGRIEKVVNVEQFENELKQLKSDVITQFLNIFNQISFVVEQEEIIDFIQEKHDELITVLSHIVTTVDDVEDIKSNVSLVDTKIDSLKEDIDLINEKITAIISADGDIDYVYSLQDLEADIANLRLILNEMKDSGNNFADLISSTEDIYKLVESVKTELPTKQDFDTMAEDIVSISTRTNKLILASDESYKNLQDNLQDFKLVINDLDERTRNFARESGLDRIDGKLNSLNNMVQNGAKTNQVFNQVFEYLAEWVDNASVQINSISNKVETLDDIGQIKAMLMDLKQGAEDNTETVELVEALGSVFDKQIKRIANLETKLDKLIVETTINSKNNKLDLSPFESTLNKFLVALDVKFTEQQEKITSLEAKLENIAEDKDSQQLTKKVAGMDRQIAKLNKSIEKITSYVVEK